MIFLLSSTSFAFYFWEGCAVEHSFPTCESIKFKFLSKLCWNFDCVDAILLCTTKSSSHIQTPSLFPSFVEFFSLANCTIFSAQDRDIVCFNLEQLLFFLRIHFQFTSPHRFAISSMYRNLNLIPNLKFYYTRSVFVVVSPFLVHTPFCSM